jgi:hypothetical protein
MTMKLECPCCQQPMPAQESPDFLQHVEGLTVYQRLIVGSLCDAYPDSLEMREIAEHVYSGYRRPPARPNETISVQLASVRRKLLGTGWTVPTNKSGPGSYGRYRLERVR